MITKFPTVQGLLNPIDNLSGLHVSGSSFSFEELATYSGWRFYSEIDLVYTNGETKYFLYKMPTSNDPVYTALYSRDFKAAGGGAEIEILWDTAYTLTANTFAVFNENRAVPTTNITTVTEVTVAVDGGVRERDFVASSGVGSHSSGGISPQSGSRLYSKDSDFILKVTNNSTGDNRIRIAYSWAEIPDSFFNLP